MNDIKTIVAKNILFYRKQNKMSQKTLAEKIGVKHNTISSWESCTNSVDIDSLFKICDALNVSVNVMMGIDDNTNNNDTLNENENYLLNTFRNLSVQGQEYILQTIDMLKDKYKKDLYSSDSQKIG
ncbi:helix-turn-helix domain-containing protein [Hominilimicola sp.]|uniref:helix-turn-helix domain-containing protein n=1 Tax=Hominilimicola sp. TaxID=3073571 RepID=UPI0039910A5F